MSDLTIRQALDGVLEAWMAARPVPIDVVFEDTQYSPTVGRPYIPAQMIAITSTPTGPGANSMITWAGTYQVTARMPSGQGTDPGSLITGEIMPLFKRGLSLVTTDGWTLLIEQTTPNPGLTQPDWTSRAVSVRWMAFEFPT